MKVQELMTSNPRTCSKQDTLASAATAMWEEDCGVVPIVEDGKPVGVITDRDICMAAALRGASMEKVRIDEVIGDQLFSCKETDDVSQALTKMQRHRVRRVPVIDRKKNLVGMLSMNDIVLATKASAGRTEAPVYKDVVQAMKGICEHRSLPATT